ncbi:MULTISPECIES: hypothetical protein [unclassified Rhizobium]|uniref:hypothetical protein n=1 Tax=unclassified Rhizobium TaxID=2613769 RepID=UPI001AE2360B|nr:MULTISPECIES: hypothetical protein [unclassified Rhizobium]MBP2463917.1 hypothetical protein [Rhizobium sp. PvP014]MBP2532283.1 hypothetical protein [Rhizobium sp. PvP099]
MLLKAVGDDELIAEFNDSHTGEAQNIKQRKLHMPCHPWLECWHNAPYWHRPHKLTPKPARIIELAKEKVMANPETLTNLEILIQAQDLIREPRHWTQHNYDREEATEPHFEEAVRR